MENESLIYHYTSINTLHEIIKFSTDKICLRATHANFMNDPEEYNYANSILSQSMHKYEKENNIANKKSKHLFGTNSLFKAFAFLGGTPFITSFSEHKDDLSMWRAYGKNGNGISIGFDKEQLKDYCNNDSVKNTNFIQCNYAKEKLIDEMMHYWEKEYNNFKVIDNGEEISCNDFNLLFSIKNLAFSAKCSSYKTEKEWRLCSNREDNILFRVKENLIIPFIEHYLSKDIIKKIIIGPCLNSSQVKLGLEMFLKENEYNITKNLIKESEISYRKI